MRIGLEDPENFLLDLGKAIEAAPSLDLEDHCRLPTADRFQVLLQLLDIPGGVDKGQFDDIGMTGDEAEIVDVLGACRIMSFFPYLRYL